MINNIQKFGKYSDIIFDGRKRGGRTVKKVAKVAYPIAYYAAVMSFATLICWGIFG